MKIYKINAREINGENGIFVKTGKTTYSFDANIVSTNGGIEKCHFVVSGVEKRNGCMDTNWTKALNAIGMAEFFMCGYLYRYSITNIKEC